MKRVERCCSGASVGPRKRQLLIETSVHVTPEGARILAEEVEAVLVALEPARNEEAKGAGVAPAAPSSRPAAGRAGASENCGDGRGWSRARGAFCDSGRQLPGTGLNSPQRLTRDQASSQLRPGTRRRGTSR